MVLAPCIASILNGVPAITVSAVMEPTGIPVTDTPSISLEFNFIINKNIDGEPSINDV